ncbi:MAG: 3-hydroxybutyryl-CoA dehydrogenase [Chloroflexi bacterium]|nr:3-hydroxybutyryl-CoA dehydrogenase [Chloroflexota bacterium]|tara:strand:- start:488 stop:1330 length:843 start_codon:yes stop_codon:yes gene_type:complete
MDKVGLVGCGTMGTGICLAFASSGYSVKIVDTNLDMVNEGLANIQSQIKRSVDRERISQSEGEAIFHRIVGDTDISFLADSDFVIEAVYEDLEIKKNIFSMLDEICLDAKIIASNTSSLAISDIASTSKRKDRILGIHFFNPVPVMELVELIGSLDTSEECFNAAEALIASLNKTAVKVKDTPGFIVNRLLIPYILDAIRVYESGVASREDIDQGITLGLNHPMGPLSLADLIGLDVVMMIAESLHRELGEPRFSPPTMLRRLVSSGNLGRKSKQGFYTY